MTKGTLFISSAQPGHEASVAHARTALTKRFGSDFSLTIVDVIQEPERAEAAHVVATPSLIVDDGDGIERFVGTLSAG